MFHVKPIIMKKVEGNIVDVFQQTITKGAIYFDDKIRRIEFNDHVESDQYIMPGFIDAHVHIESSMLTPLEYSKIAVKHGVIAAITDTHEIANVCGIDGVFYMVENAKNTPMKIFFGAPSCVPATTFETSGAKLLPNDIEYLFENSVCSHLSEMMNFPGVIYNDKSVHEKIKIAQKYNKIIDGHAPLLSGTHLKSYIDAGISTDHECTNLSEAYEKIAHGMMIMLRNSSASKDFHVLMDLIATHPNDIMFCTDDCHPDDLYNGYINLMVAKAINKGYSFFNVINAATKNIVKHYNFDVGLLQIDDDADFIIVNDLNDFRVKSTFIKGNAVYNNDTVFIDAQNSNPINNFFVNAINEDSLKLINKQTSINVIEIIPDSLLTKKRVLSFNSSSENLNSDIDKDVLKVIVLNRYSKGDAQVGFIKGYGLKSGAIASTIAHDSHNIIAVGVNDEDILKAIHRIQKNKGGLVVYNDGNFMELSLPIAGLMSDQSCEVVAKEYKVLNDFAKSLGTQLKTPFMTLAFMSLLVIPEIKIGDHGLFDVNQFKFIDLQN